MIFQKQRTRKFLRVSLGFLFLLFCINVLFMYILYLQNTNLREVVYRPSIKTLITHYKKAQLNYADVDNHILLIKRGYAKINTKIKRVEYGKDHINWAYPPLHPTLGRLVNVFIKSPFWSLWLIHQIVLLSIFIGFYYWSEANLSGFEKKLSAWIVFFFFVLTPLCYFINFMIIPGLLFGIIFLSLRKWLKSPEEHSTAFWILAISSFLTGFSRFQGMAMNASLLFLIVILTVWYKKPLGKTKAIILSTVNILPFLITLCIFKYYANDPFAWYKIQAGWGVSLSWPWKIIIRYWKSWLVFNLFSDDLFFTTFRLLVFSIFAFLTFKIILCNTNFLQDFFRRHYSRNFINLFFTALSFGILILPFLQGVMLAAHRLMTLAFLLPLIWFEQGRRVHISVILFLLFVRAVEFTLFFQGVRAFIW